MSLCNYKNLHIFNFLCNFHLLHRQKMLILQLRFSYVDYRAYKPVEFHKYKINTKLNFNEF